MKLVILGRGGSGKSTFAKRTGLPYVELDKLFWGPDLKPQPLNWLEVTAGESWVIDGDLGKYDDLVPRVVAADAVIVLDISLWRCVWRVLRRGPENLEFWHWMLTYRRRYLPRILTQVPVDKLILLRTPNEVETFLKDLSL